MKNGLLHIIERETAGLSAEELSSWLSEHRTCVDDALRRRGAVLFRGAAVNSRDGFERVCRALTPRLRPYIGGGSWRKHLGGLIYTSTEYSASASIPLHCEASYFPDMPSRIWFYCHRPAAESGETPIGDMGGFHAKLDRRLVDQFRTEGVRYVMNLHAGVGFGKSWMQVYETEEREVVEAFLVAQGARFAWTDNGGLRVELRAPAIHRHPETGEEVWINQATAWHPAHLGPEHYKRMIRLYQDELSFPKAAFFGDGAPIKAEDIDRLTDALSAQETAFPWKQGDVLLVDNDRIAHGRRPFKGARAVYVGLA